jgi:hypothetical protein
MEPERRRPGESGTGRENTMTVWNRKGEDQERLQPEVARKGGHHTGREKVGKCGVDQDSTGGFAKNNQNRHGRGI